MLVLGVSWVQVSLESLNIYHIEDSIFNGIFQRAGNGEQTNSRCGQTLGIKGCLNHDLHGFISLDGKNHTGNVFIRLIVHSCDKPECPVCFKRGWAVREASAIEYRIKEASKLFGLAEHITVMFLKLIMVFLTQKLSRRF